MTTVKHGLRWFAFIWLGGMWLTCMAAVQCGKIRLLHDKSRGVEVLLNACPGNEQLAEGTILRIAPSARLWLKAASEGETREYQMVCQSRAEAAIPVLLESSEPPWIGSHLLDCSEWDGHQFSCNGSDGRPNVLFCVAGQFEKPLPETRPQRGTAIVLRSLTPDEGGLEDRARQQAVLEAIKNEARLCHEVYGVTREFGIEWEVDPEGKAGNITPSVPMEQIHPGFSDCLLDTVRFHPYPKSSRTVYLNAML